MMRVFFALELDGATALHIANWRERQLACAGTPVPLANFHITLAFLGALGEPAIERLCLSVDDWLKQSALPGATLQLDTTGYWPKPGIFWLGPGRWPEQLTRLAQKLNSLGSAAGAKRDRNPFQPHITLYRQCSVPPPAPTLAPSINLRYANFALFESRQGKRGGELPRAAGLGFAARHKIAACELHRTTDAGAVLAQIQCLPTRPPPSKCATEQRD